jgi:hypothetical protein
MQELSAVLGVLGTMPDDAVADSNCSDLRQSLAWGLLSLAEQEAWYAGDRRNWTFDAQNLATAGPAGLRLGILSPAAEAAEAEAAEAAEPAEELEAHVRHFNLG